MRIVDKLLMKILDWWHPIKFDPNAPPPTEAELSALEDPKHGTISYDDTRLSVKAPNFRIAVNWNEISHVFCYKRDLWSTDLICIGFSREDNAPIVEVHEEMQGFHRFLKELHSHFPGAEQKWFKWILDSPAFDNTITTIWRKESHNHTSEGIRQSADGLSKPSM